MRPVRDRGEVKKLPSFAHVQATQGDQHEGLARPPDARTVRSGFGQQVC